MFGVTPCLAFGIKLLCLAAAGALVAVALTLLRPEGTGFLPDLKLWLAQFPYVIYAAMLVVLGSIASGVGLLLALFGLLLPGRHRARTVLEVALNALGLLPYTLLAACSYF